MLPEVESLREEPDITLSIVNSKARARYKARIIARSIHVAMILYVSVLNV